MIDDISSYSLSDFLLFSKETYLGMFERYNEALWPAHILAVLLGAGMLWIASDRPSGNRTVDRHRGRIASFVLLSACGWVGWAFFLQRYSTINPLASYLGVLFFIEAGLVFWFGLVFGKIESERPTGASSIGVAMIAYAVFIHPFVGLLAGRSFSQLAVFGLAPDPTALAALGLALVDRRKVRWLLLLTPLLWCIVSMLTAIGLSNIEWIILAAAGAAALIGSIWKALAQRN